MNLCPSTYVGVDGWHYTCDKAPGHDGPHEAADFDPDTEAFKEAEWTDPVPVLLVGFKVTCDHAYNSPEDMAAGITRVNVGVDFSRIQQKHHPDSKPEGYERQLGDHFPEDDQDEEP